MSMNSFNHLQVVNYLPDTKIVSSIIGLGFSHILKVFSSISNKVVHNCEKIPRVSTCAEPKLMNNLHGILIISILRTST